MPHQVSGHAAVDQIKNAFVGMMQRVIQVKQPDSCFRLFIHIVLGGIINRDYSQREIMV